jgi:glycosyltransferase involved in cell wall biosynthesis
MRIALIVTQGEHGGVQDLLDRFMRWLTAKGHEVSVICGPGEWLENRCKQAGIPFTRLKHLKREIHPVQDFLAIKELCGILEKIKPDAVHLNSTKAGVIGSLAIRYSLLATRPRVVYRIGGWVFLEDISPIKKWLYKMVEKRTAHFKDTIICVHPGDVEVADKIGIKPKQKIVSVPNGIDTDAFSSQLLSRDQARAEIYSLQSTDFIFGTIANFYPPKDLPRYIEACSIVAKELRDARFVLIGDGEQRDLIEQEIKRFDLTDRVNLVGAREDADRLYNAFDVFVLPSSKEGMSWALLKAMAAGVPSIATDVGAADWMLSPDAGLIVPPKQPPALAEAMIRLAKDESLRKTYSENGKKQIASRFQEEATYRGNLEALMS